MRKPISGYVCVRNAIELDYCVVEAVKSLIPVCDEVVVCDGESTDGTLDLIRSIGDSRIRIVTYPWPHPVGNPKFWVQWLNFARKELAHKFQLTLDADEVLWEGGYDRIRQLADAGEAGIFGRFNFWKDAQHLAPLNTVCGDTVARCGPTRLYMPSDEPVPAVFPNVRDLAEYCPELKIYHYGFLRKPDAFLKKSKEVQTMFMGSCDKRILNMEASGQVWHMMDYFNGEPLREFTGQHPEVARQWLRDRGYTP